LALHRLLKVRLPNYDYDQHMGGAVYVFLRGIHAQGAGVHLHRPHHPVPNTGTMHMKRKHQKTLEAVYARPVSANIQWRDIETLFVEMGADISEREGSRIAVVLFDEVRVFHRPHPSPDTDKGAVASIRKWFEQHGIAP
jgi:hypothetical protein